MRIFSAKPNRNPPPAESNGMHPYAAVPLRGERVEARVSSRGDLHLHVTLPPGNRWERTLFRLTGAGKTRQVVLDEKGAFFWKQIDGKNNLFAIRRALETEYRLSETESGESTILFVKMLMRRHFIRIQMEPHRNSTP